MTGVPQMPISGVMSPLPVSPLGIVVMPVAPAIPLARNEVCHTTAPLSASIA